MKYRAITTVILLIAVLMTAMAFSIPAQAEDNMYHGKKTVKRMWTQLSDDGVYARHRIPGIVVTKKDTVIVYCEARTDNTAYSLKDSNDWCLMDIYIQRSTDGGNTFGEPIYIARGSKEFATMNNPVMIVGNDNTLHMLYCRNYSILGGGLWYTKSTDDGVTWSEAREVTQYAESVPHDTFAFGPTHGICTDDGVLMTAIWLAPRGAGDDITSHGPSSAYVFYSKDNGESWNMSEKADKNPNETDIVQLSDGNIMLNSRSSPYRKVTTSQDGITGWTTTYNDLLLIDPSCCGGMTAVDLEGYPYAVLFANCADKTDRKNVTLRCSFDDGKTWDKSLLLDANNGGYVDVAVDSKGCIFVLYEIDRGLTVNLVRLSFIDEFIGDDPTLTAKGGLDFSNPTENSVTELRNAESSMADGVVNITMTSDRVPQATVDFTGINRNINLREKTAVVLKAKATTSAGGEMSNVIYFRSGSTHETSSKRFASFTLPADGEWHNVVLDLSETAVKGNLYSMQFEFFSDTFRCNIGDVFSLDSIEFYATVEEAERALGISDESQTTTAEVPVETTTAEAPVETTTDEAPVETTTDEAPVETTTGKTDDKGCGNMSFAALLAALFPATVIIKKKKSA